MSMEEPCAAHVKTQHQALGYIGEAIRAKQKANESAPTRRSIKTPNLARRARRRARARFANEERYNHPRNHGRETSGSNMYPQSRARRPQTPEDEAREVLAGRPVIIPLNFESGCRPVSGLWDDRELFLRLVTVLVRFQNSLDRPDRTGNVHVVSSRFAKQVLAGVVLSHVPTVDYDFTAKRCDAASN